MLTFVTMRPHSLEAMLIQQLVIVMQQVVQSDLKKASLSVVFRFSQSDTDTIKALFAKQRRLLNLFFRSEEFSEEQNAFIAQLARICYDAFGAEIAKNGLVRQIETRDTELAAIQGRLEMALHAEFLSAVLDVQTVYDEDELRERIGRCRTMEELGTVYCDLLPGDTVSECMVHDRMDALDFAARKGRLFCTPLTWQQRNELSDCQTLAQVVAFERKLQAALASPPGPLLNAARPSIDQLPTQRFTLPPPTIPVASLPPGASKKPSVQSTRSPSGNCLDNDGRGCNSTPGSGSNSTVGSRLPSIVFGGLHC